MRLKGKTALIAGSASGVEGRLMGIGGATVRRFAREGAQVVIADIKDEIGEQTAAEIRAEGGEALYVHLDVTEESEWMAAVEAAIDRFGKLEVLVDAAGTSIRHKVEETPVEDFDLEMAVHARGAFLGSKHASTRCIPASYDAERPFSTCGDHRPWSGCPCADSAPWTRSPTAWRATSRHRGGW